MNAYQAREDAADERERMERFGEMVPPAVVVPTDSNAGRSMRAEFFRDHHELAPPCERNRVIHLEKSA
jgi:hypothetical protein